MKTGAVRDIFHYNGLRPLDSLTAAIKAGQPELIIPCCDRSVRHLHELHGRSQEQGNRELVALIERSLGSPASYSTVCSRYELIEAARLEGVRVPRTERLQSPEQLATWQDTPSFPCVLKVDGTWGGGGIRIAHHADEVWSSLAQLDRMFGLKRALKRLVVNRDSFWLRLWWCQRPHEVVAQAYIPGRPANCAVACWKGRLLGGISCEVINSDGATGPASIVRIVDNPEMMFAAERIAGRLELSGLFGLDFMIEEGTNAAYLIEMNPRTTPLCHLRLGPGRDMAGALWAQLAAQPALDAPTVTSNKLIAYFPQACASQSELLESSFLDVPLGEPELIEELRRPWPDRTLLSRFLVWLSRRPTLTSTVMDSPGLGFGPDRHGIQNPFQSMSNEPASEESTSAAHRRTEI